MGWQATGWAFKAPIENSGCKFVLVALAERAGNEDDEKMWYCHPSIQTIGKYTAQGYRTIQRHLDWLEANGYISRRQRMQSKGKKGAYDYTLNPHQWENGYFGRWPDGAPEGAEIGQTEPVNGTSQDIVGAREPEADPFETWWVHYPRKVAKAAAVAAFPAALLKFKCATPLATLIEATIRFAEEVKGRPVEKIPHPATWLNAERWSDEPGSNGSHADERTANGLDRGAAQHGARVESMLAGAAQALNARRRWTLGG